MRLCNETTRRGGMKRQSFFFRRWKIGRLRSSLLFQKKKNRNSSFVSRRRRLITDKKKGDGRALGVILENPFYSLACKMLTDVIICLSLVCRRSEPGYLEGCLDTTGTAMTQCLQGLYKNVDFWNDVKGSLRQQNRRSVTAAYHRCWRREVNVLLDNASDVNARSGYHRRWTELVFVVIIMVLVFVGVIMDKDGTDNKGLR